MARTNLSATRIKPETAELLTLRVLRRERISPHFARVTLGGGEIDRFAPMGFDQWFRLVIPVSDTSLTWKPKKFNALALARYLTMAKATRPVLRNYSVRAYRPDGPTGPELDVDFVLHGSVADGTAGPAATWAQTCAEGDVVAILDEGIGFNPRSSLRRVLLVADESGLPAVAGVLASLPPDTRGTAVIEVPSTEDRQALSAPAGVEVRWLVRDGGTPGQAALAHARRMPLPDEPFYGWVVGESGLAVALRRHWVNAGVPKGDIMFCGYWKAGRAH
ncbi:NADPH-dependent ferric siderophore reductase, contains FAD-binding and SIP domains [Streptoalloteichus tenebrarius]|uniref:NADPH-dependent ferric siderophore reductase, contains FAD-binding and SIP domains n=1 Tax=Streptoalloteichus tenebrarius (strain ATCC 17920 / DSM 40477 / JCM 4838 / CBS 697.72 / NBRC 16177 / NCIMB 11028 / NRRL B-12390 / A12253. 1 / ISP 5477) TaxID=1933 RepID=A0ABT1HTK5_STRSD|nr:siderophore-interacting protein [Streptoalloteichus tenebrarius]MCP2258858.1 NADPH-dependent ferric siderophore reductase, contains FAD-binding and SIP domains [Streptoalloteichus tenebrarius]BFE99458.1 siderophore-interacting protein [Streptoalloteichus tenebrarius]